MEEEKDSQRIQSGPGKVVRTDEEGKPAYEATFESSALRLDDKGAFAGLMEKVTGKLITEDGGGTTYRADRARAERESDLLVLEGNVTIVNDVEKIELKCDRLVWRRKDGRVEAEGNVTVIGQSYTLGPASEVWASPDLQEIATPKLFQPAP